MAESVQSPHEGGRRGRKTKKLKKGVVFGNAKAGKNMGRQQLFDAAMKIIHEELGPASSDGSHVRVKVHMTRSLEELGEVKEAAMREEPPDFAVVFGGDGTMQKTLGEDPAFLQFLTADPENACEVVFLGTGSQIVILKALKLLGGDDDAVRLAFFRTICQKYARGIPRDTTCRPILQVNGRRGFIYASGVAVNVLDDEYTRYEPGRSRVFKTGLGIILRETLGRLNPWHRPSIFRHFEAAASWRDAEKIMREGPMREYNGFVASSLGEINPWVKVTYRAGERLGCFHGLGLNNGFFRTALNVPAMIGGGPMIGDMQDMITDRMVIRYADARRHTIDGELYDTKDLGSPGAAFADAADETVVIQTGPYIRFVIS